MGDFETAIIGIVVSVISIIITYVVTSWQDRELARRTTNYNAKLTIFTNVNGILSDLHRICLNFDLLAEIWLMKDDKERIAKLVKVIQSPLIKTETGYGKEVLDGLKSLIGPENLLMKVQTNRPERVGKEINNSVLYNIFLVLCVEENNLINRLLGTSFDVGLISEDSKVEILINKIIISVDRIMELAPKGIYDEDYRGLSQIKERIHNEFQPSMVSLHRSMRDELNNTLRKKEKRPQQPLPPEELLVDSYL
jgi:hypothetical protein